MEDLATRCVRRVARDMASIQANGGTKKEAYEQWLKSAEASMEGPAQSAINSMTNIQLLDLISDVLEEG